ncbi:MAG: hypothetical protein AAF438_05845 [Pseudomonadota bacterium]
MTMTTPFNEAKADYKPESPSLSDRVQGVLHSMSQIATLSQLMRLLGAAIMVGGLSLFLMQGWHSGNDANRFFTLLGHTLLLTGGGFLLSHGMKEFKGARLFFGLGLISVTANFTVLGALIYSVTGNPDASAYPSFASWVMQDPSQMTWIVLGTLFVLLPITLLAYSILARRSAKWLTTSYLIGNALLLIPTRSSETVGLLVLLSVVIALYALGRYGSKDETLSTFEGGFAKLTLFVPAGLMLARSWLLYDIEALATAILCTSAYIILRYIEKFTDEMPFMRGLIGVTSMVLISVIAASLALGLWGQIPSYALIPIFAGICLSMSVDLIKRHTTSRRGPIFGFMLTLVVCLSIGINELSFQGLIPSILAVFLWSAAIGIAYWFKHRWSFIVAAALGVYLLFINFFEMVRWHELYNWVTLSIIGAAIILSASLLDRHGVSIKLRLEKLRDNVMS